MKTVIVILAVIIVASFVLTYAINTVRLFVAKRRIDKSLKGEKPNDGGSD